MRLITHRDPQEVIKILDQRLIDIQLPERFLESLRVNARYQSFLSVGTPIDVNCVVNLPKQTMKFLIILKYHCLLRRHDKASSVILAEIDRVLNPDYDQQRISPLLFNNPAEGRLFFLQSNYFSDSSLIAYIDEYEKIFKNLNIYFSVKYKHERPINIPQRKRGYNDKGNSPDPRKSIMGKNYPIPLDPNDLDAYWEKLERIKSYQDTIQFLYGLMI